MLYVTFIGWLLWSSIAEANLKAPENYLLSIFKNLLKEFNKTYLDDYIGWSREDSISIYIILLREFIN